MVKSKDSENSCNEQMLEGTVAHSTLEILLREHELTDNESLTRMRETDYIIF